MHSDNYIEANPLVTPLSIVPEWYLLPFYAILRAIPSKIGGVICMILAILILLILPFIHSSRIRSSNFKPINKYFFWLFIANFLLLIFLGGKPIDYPYIQLGQIATMIYFVYFLILIPITGIIENILPKISRPNKL